MSDAPERIWADPPEIFDGMDIWRIDPGGKGVEYIRADLHRAEVEAAVKRALDAVMTRLQNVELPVEVADDTFDAGWFWMLGEAQSIVASDPEALRRIVEGGE
jgi:hypothetical protein